MKAFFRKSSGFFDAHRHLPVLLEATCSIVNGTTVESWAEIAHEAENFPTKIIPAFGIHPWYVNDLIVGWQDVLKGYLKQFPYALIGETGLDKSRKWKGSFDRQKVVFADHLEIAQKYQRGLCLHCVQAWGAMLEMIRDVSVPLLFHDYRGSAEITKILLKKDAYFSFPWGSLCPFDFIPEERRLFETDSREALLRFFENS